MSKCVKCGMVLFVASLLFGCAEPEIPKVEEDLRVVVEENKEVEKIDYVDTEVYEESKTLLLFEQRVLELAGIGEALTFGDVEVYEDSLKEEADTPENCNRYVYTKGGARYQLVITWEEGIEPQDDTPLLSAVLSLVSDPTICADIMRENPAIVTNVVVRPGGK